MVLKFSLDMRIALVKRSPLKNKDLYDVCACLCNVTNMTKRRIDETKVLGTVPRERHTVTAVEIAVNDISTEQNLTFKCLIVRNKRKAD